jgi:hypothetical protein
MTTLRQLFAAVVLVITLTLPTFAGEITTMGAPPPTNTDGDIHTGIAGDMHTGVSGEISTGGSVTDAALALIESVLALF